MRYNTLTLPNGLRVIHQPAESPILYCGFQIAAGSRHEEPQEYGIAHLCEHMAFKGTKHRKAWHLTNTLEALGAELNAFTTKEHTVYYAALLKQYTTKAVEILADIVFHASYPESELCKEIDVVGDEIETFNDSPAELIYDEFENILFKGHPLGHSILGKTQQLKTYTPQMLSRFRDKHYRTDNAVFFAYGDIDFKKLVALLQKYTPGRPADNLPGVTVPHAQITDTHAQTITLKHHTHLAHVMVGSKSYSLNHPNRISLYLLNNILGGPASNARFNNMLREKKALVYNVESTHAYYLDTGVWSVCFAAEKQNVQKCLRLIHKELQHMCDTQLTDTQIKAAKKQIKGQIALGAESHEQMALDFGKAMLFNAAEQDMQTLCQRIDEVTAQQLQQVACEIFREESLTTLIIE